MYDLGCMLAINRDPSWYSTDYRVYMGSSMIVRLLRRLPLYLYSYKLDGAVTNCPWHEAAPSAARLLPSLLWRSMACVLDGEQMAARRQLQAPPSCRLKIHVGDVFNGAPVDSSSRPTELFFNFEIIVSR